jgi:hypothetical protein
MPHLGRTQLGRELPLGIRTHDAFGNSINPDEAPTVHILKSTGVVVATLQIPAVDKFNRKGFFAFGLLLDGRFSTGRYFVVYSWQMGDLRGRLVDSFDIVRGGHKSGRVQAAHWLAQPHSSFIYFQTSDGVVHKGRSPSVVT